MTLKRYIYMYTPWLMSVFNFPRGLRNMLRKQDCYYKNMTIFKMFNCWGEPANHCHSGAHLQILDLTDRVTDRIKMIAVSVKT